MPNVLDVDSSFMAANAAVEKWRAKFLERWLAPIEETKLVIWWAAQSPEMHATMKALSPAAYAEVEKKIESIRERSTRNNGLLI